MCDRSLLQRNMTVIKRQDMKKPANQLSWLFIIYCESKTLNFSFLSRHFLPALKVPYLLRYIYANL